MSSSLPPPPPGYPAAPDTPEEALPPPPVEEVAPDEVHESDVLKRQGRFSWKQFGGDGFMVSLAIHIILAILGIFWVVSTYTAPAKKGDPDVFATGAGGGNNGDKAKMFEHKMKSRNTQVKLPSRIVSKNPNSSISLPSTPNTATASFATGLSSGGMSKGSGGGSGGGEGTGIGIGKGGGRNLVTAFGSFGANSPGLPGTLYDCKQSPEGVPNKFMNDHTGFLDEVMRLTIQPGWTASKNFSEKYFKSPDQLYASQIFIPVQSSLAAPKAYGVEDKVKQSRWLCEYAGLITAPKSGRFRFWVYADDICIIRLDKKIVADNGWTILHLPGFGQGANTSQEVFPGVSGEEKKEISAKGATAGKIVLRPGPWFNVERGRDYVLQINMADVGGLFGSYVLMEEADPSKRSKGDGQLFLFRMSEEALPEWLVDDTGLNIDLTGKKLNWKGRGDKKAKAIR